MGQILPNFGLIRCEDLEQLQEIWTRKLLYLVEVVITSLM